MFMKLYSCIIICLCIIITMISYNITMQSSEHVQIDWYIIDARKRKTDDKIINKKNSKCISDKQTAVKSALRDYEMMYS